MNRMIVCRLTDSEWDGRWIEVTKVPVLCQQFSDGHHVRTTMVPTGSVEWREDDACAEVYVPVDRLRQWFAEFAVEDVR